MPFFELLITAYCTVKSCILFICKVLFSFKLKYLVFNIKALLNCYSWTGITFSFFWKNKEIESRFAIASGGKIISSGFSVYSNPHGGYVEFYTRGDSKTWKAKIELPGSYYLSLVYGKSLNVWGTKLFCLISKAKKRFRMILIFCAHGQFEMHSGLELHLQSDHKYFEYVVVFIIILITSGCRNS